MKQSGAKEARLIYPKYDAFGLQKRYDFELDDLRLVIKPFDLKDLTKEGSK
jgi:hypothetical protein